MQDIEELSYVLVKVVPDSDIFEPCHLGIRDPVSLTTLTALYSVQAPKPTKCLITYIRPILVCGQGVGTSWELDLYPGRDCLRPGAEDPAYLAHLAYWWQAWGERKRHITPADIVELWWDFSVPQTPKTVFDRFVLESFPKKSNDRFKRTVRFSPQFCNVYNTELAEKCAQCGTKAKERALFTSIEWRCACGALHYA